MSEDIEQLVDTNPVEFKKGEEPPTPLFLKDSPEGNKGNDQDEKDETEE
jgi:hypothetical protein